MGIPHLTTFLRPYATAESLAGKHVVVDGPSFAYHIYYICLKASPGARNGLEAAPSYQNLVETATSWLAGIEDSSVEIKKIYFDGFLPVAKLAVRLQRLQNSTYQLTKFHQSHNEPCRSTYPQRGTTSLALFHSTAVRSGLTALPALSFIVPAILEALKASARYTDITEVVPGEADLYCARYLKEHGGLVLTSDSDLLVHDLGDQGAVSFFGDIESSVLEAPYTLRTLIFEPAAISDRLKLPKSHRLYSLAFEISMDAHGTFPKYLTQAQSLHAITNHSQMFAEFLQEYSLFTEPKVAADSYEALRVLRCLDPRTSEYVLQFPSISDIAGQPSVSGKAASSSPHVFLPFLLDCPVRTNAFEVSAVTRQLAYGLLNIIVPASERRSSVFEHRRQINKSNGRELMLPEVSDISDACNSVLETFKGLKTKFPKFKDIELWIAFAIHQDIEWSISASKVATSQVFLQRMSHQKTSYIAGFFDWDVVQFFAQLQGSLYSCRILQQITSLVMSNESKYTIPQAVLRLNSLLRSVPSIVDYPDLGTASAAIRKSDEEAKFMRIVKEVVNALDVSTATSGLSKAGKSSKNKRKRDRVASELPPSKAISSNPFALLGSG
ncbi:uncharacterized protein RSE6_14097 [Rhynchosporium secalis]|uniref:Asteroid domain-containing protein n=1 Tax=Rhynchosporium secalis TaxID=38038 RepID=A0A1E1MUF5_RHYSE|nr:uncharacterized protein RSE6_14097 [Rhynchosporium secalis]